MIGYIGGKARLARQIVQLLPKHTTYVEPFAGLARVLFAKPPSRCEILNDIDGDVVNYMRVCQLHHRELRRYLRYMVSSRQMFTLYAKQDVKGLSDIQRAARFAYLQRFGFGGKVTGRSYTVQRPFRGPLTGRLMTRDLRNTARRLLHVQLECAPYETILRQYDHETTLFYCDPPYVGRKVYSSAFAADDYARLAEHLSRLRGRFLLSLNDHPLVHSLFGHFRCRELAVYYSLHPTSRKPLKELVFANYDIDAGDSSETLHDVDNSV